ncbi:hypothetical protein DW672_02700 [[Ruminococcus] lactaris]|uniref:Uncharacterized protein n=1 Tax=[Ruminococcus] lactaris TaxID=46228 RepID=A0A414P8D6_9FIRM|nr:hypothetical protein DW672_02700 [[Ruminococcus] lactaris]
MLPITPFRIILAYFVLSCPTQQGYYIRLSEKCNTFFEKITLEFLNEKHENSEKSENSENYNKGIIQGFTFSVGI